MQYLVYLHEIVVADNHHALFHFLWPQAEVGALFGALRTFDKFRKLT